MSIALKSLRPVYVVGIGLHRYQKASDKSYIELGLTSIRQALADARISWKDIQKAYVGNALLGMAPGLAMLRHLGATGIPLTHVENASASGSTAVHHACYDVAAGLNDCILAVGVDKIGANSFNIAWTGVDNLVDTLPVVHFDLIANEYMHRYGVDKTQIAKVALKNHNNASHNPYAQFQKQRTLEEIMAKPIAGSLTRLQCCPLGEGAAAVIIASEKGIERLGIDGKRCVEVLASVNRSERLYNTENSIFFDLTKETVDQAYLESDISPKDLNVIELHDAFSVEEFIYAEAMGLCEKGGGAQFLETGKSQIGGQCAISPSGGLIAMGHPFGPTGVGQICEVVRQLRGEAGPRQQPDARIGLCHMVGIGLVCIVHILRKI